MTASSENLALIGRDFDKMKASIVCLANDIPCHDHDTVAVYNSLAPRKHMQHHEWVMAIGRPVCANVICNSARACQFHETIKAWIVNCRHISCDVSPNVCSIEILQSSGNSGKKLPWSTFHPNLPSENRFSTNLSYWRNRHLLKTGHFRVQALKKKKAAAGKKAAPSDAVKAAAAESWHGRRNGRRNVSEDSGDSSPNGRFKFYLPGLENVYITMKNHHFQWVNPLFLWPFSIAMLVYQRVCSSIELWFSRIIVKYFWLVVSIFDTCQQKYPQTMPSSKQKFGQPGFWGPWQTLAFLSFRINCLIERGCIILWGTGV